MYIYVCVYIYISNSLVRYHLPLSASPVFSIQKTRKKRPACTCNENATHVDTNSQLYIYLHKETSILVEKDLRCVHICKICTCKETSIHVKRDLSCKYRCNDTSIFVKNIPIYICKKTFIHVK